MYFSVGIEEPKDGEAFGLLVPALCTDNFSCYSAADCQEDIAPMVTAAITMLLEQMQEDGLPVQDIKDAGVMAYQKLTDYAFCDAWLLVHVDMSAGA